ncbi:hypothetical protein [Listeria booriae]|uniref:hypothetical protein n=1 Tax=Listeria booriae TaxID=1552123 RepID=UPI001628F882|nr:hypothetical protein [Listeria booriae]MBC1892434.1 hypothetical protein [Listeria booriae]MBC1974549.1 hypothetical protein [Listeria booriae]MBC1983481.1 hypothetical protein [Listeria booriae]MBC2031841.1 hypothetical protein [Listeria booriae]
MENNQEFEGKVRKAFEEMVKLIKKIAVAIDDFVKRAKKAIKHILSNYPETKKYMQIASNTNNSRIKRKNIKKLRLLFKGGRLFN